MILIGYWIDRIHGSPFPAPQECVGKLDPNVRNQVADYLESARLYEQYRGLSWCRFCCGGDFSKMGSKEFTDGEWIWPEGLSHYVRNHGVILPEEFIAWVRQKSLPPSFPESVNLSFWIEWGERRRDPTCRRELRRVYLHERQRILAELRELKAKRLPAVTPATTCLWHGCNSQTHAGRAFCEYHQVSQQSKREMLACTHGSHHLLTQFLKSFSVSDSGSSEF